MNILLRCVLALCVSVLGAPFALAASFSSVTNASGTQRGACPYENIVRAVITSSSGANTSLIAAQGAGVRVYLEQVIVFNSGASNGELLLTDGTGGTSFAKVPYPASTGTTINFTPPIPFTANTAIFADPTGSDNIDITAIGCLRGF